jgi:hypothetical protein
MRQVAHAPFNAICQYSPSMYCELTNLRYSGPLKMGIVNLQQFAVKCTCKH